MNPLKVLPVVRLIVPLGTIAADASTPSISIRAAIPAMPDALSEPGKPVMALPDRLLLKRVLYLVAILLLPGALIAVVLLWWLDRRKIRVILPRASDG